MRRTPTRRAWRPPTPRVTPMALDAVQRRAGRAVAEAVGVRKRAAMRVGRSVESVNQWCAGSESNPMYRALTLARACEHPERLVVEMEVEALRPSLEPMSDDELRAEYDDLTRRMAPLADGRERVVLSYGTAEEQRAALIESARLRKRAVAILDLLMERRAL